MKMVTLDDPLLERLSPEQRTQIDVELRKGVVVLLGDGTHVLVSRELGAMGPTVPANLQRLLDSLDRSAFTLPALPDPHEQVARALEQLRNDASVTAAPGYGASSAFASLRQHRRSCRTPAQRKARAKAKAAKQARKKQRGKR
jgi:hypothetical protein